MRKSNYLLYIVLAIAIAVFIWMSLYYKSEAHRFFGLAASHEHSINFPYAVKIQKMNVYNGQDISKGEVLATLIRSDVVREKELLEQQVNELKAEESLKENQINSQIKQIELENKIEINKIKDEIETLNQRSALNRELMRGISSAESNSNKIITVKLNQLQRKLENITHLSQIQINNLHSQYNKQAHLYKEKIKQLRKKLDMLREDETKLKIIAPFDGVVNSVLHTQDEDIKEFETIMVLSPKEPTFIRAYIHVDALNTLHIGQKVSIIGVSQAHKDEQPIIGVIKNFSSDIMAYPDRLKRYRNVAVWGREVIIDIPNNNFVLGEKVIVINENNSNNLDKLAADAISIFQKNSQIK
jgi:multidrug resistance efflux pump